jgi:hypothetical protein
MKFISERVIEADEGMMLTDGNIYALSVRLGDWDKAENWREIPKAEYDAILAQQEEEQQEV